MRVLYFHQHFVTPRGAGGIRSYAMARALVAAGHQVTMVCGSAVNGSTGLSGPFRKGRRRGPVDGIDVLEFELPYSNRLSFLRRALVFLSFSWRSIGVALTHDYDVLFATSTPLTAAIPGIVARGLRRKPFVFEVRDLWPELPQAMGVITNPVVLSMLRMLEWCAYHSARRTIALAPGIAAGVQRRGIEPERIDTIPNGCDLDIFEADAPAWRPAGVDAGDLLAVFAGAHGLANGLGAVLDAATVLKARGRRDIKILLIGDGQQKVALMERARAQDLANVVFLAPVDKRRLSGLMRAADLGLQILANVEAFYYGTSPNKFFDYLAAGLPVLNNYPGWLAEMIGRWGCGFAVPPGDAEAFADALERAAADRRALQAMGRRARELARAQFNRRHLAERFVASLESVWLGQAARA